MKKVVIMFKNKTVLITGGTGTLGLALTKRLLKMDVSTIRIYSRDELKQTKMQEEFSDERLRFFIGDVRDEKRLHRAMDGVDIVFHTAALKQVPIGEYNPFETIKTNVYGTQNVVEACYDKEVQASVAIGTDKAVSPLNTYGASKLLMEKIFTSANFYRGSHKTKFITVRYGNVLGSRGSIIPKLLEQIGNKNEITITDPKMTRFNITQNQAVDLVLRALKYGRGGEIFVPKLKAYTVETVKDAILELVNRKVKVKQIPVRPGEKKHEMLINENEIEIAYESESDYIIPTLGIENIVSSMHLSLKKANLSSPYTSSNVELLDKEELKRLIVEEGLIQ